MINNKKILVVMPAYNAEKTLIKTYQAIPFNVVDEVILVDDKSNDRTIAVAKRLDLFLFTHESNKGYGANQKTCYREALARGADIIIMLHPDYQYDPRLITAMSSLIAEGIYDAVLASRILGGKSLRGGMPIYKYFSNRFLTLFENIFTGEKLSEYHTGYRAFSKEVFKALPILENSDDFVFDNEMLAQIIFFKFKIGEISCPTKYEKDSSSINFLRSVKYGLQVILVSLKYFFARKKLYYSRIFNADGKRLS